MIKPGLVLVDALLLHVDAAHLNETVLKDHPLDFI